jgi:uncharacterized protein with NRDE domain
MCTITILRDLDRTLVTMNRDDIAAREEAPPFLWLNAELPFVAPKDLQAGGTWIGVNARGLVACLLNRYDAAPTGCTSRGEIVLDVMRAASVEDGCGVLRAVDHRAYSPFTCLIVSAVGAARLDWTGRRFERDDLPAASDTMLTSSSWQATEVSAQRQALFQKLSSNCESAASRAASFHSERDIAHDAWAPMMQRPYSETKSVTQIELSQRGAEMRYWTRDAAIARGLEAPVASIQIEVG